MNNNKKHNNKTTSEEEEEELINQLFEDSRGFSDDFFLLEGDREDDLQEDFLDGDLEDRRRDFDWEVAAAVRRGVSVSGDAATSLVEGTRASALEGLGSNLEPSWEGWVFLG